jgi:hypothetical protein
MEKHKFAHLPKTPVVVEGVEYYVSGDFAALVEAEAYFNLSGHNVNLAGAIFNARDPRSGLTCLRQLLPCALHTHHPTLDYLQVQWMIDRLFAVDDFAFIEAVRRMWPASTEEQEEANQNLCFDLGALAGANERFAGKAGLALIFAGDTFTLDHACRVFNCAVHKFRPDLPLTDARRLMTVQSVRLVIAGLESSWTAASRESKGKFVERLFAVASDEEQQELRFRVLAKQSWAQA